MQQFFVETPHPQGPYGARGVAEHPMISVPGAIGNALANATGVEFFELPLDPERVYLRSSAPRSEPRPTTAAAGGRSGVARGRLRAGPQGLATTTRCC